MKKELLELIFAALSERESTIQDKGHKIANEAYQKCLALAIELILQMGFTSKSILQNMGVKQFLFLYKYNIPFEHMKQALSDAELEIRNFKLKKDN